MTSNVHDLSRLTRAPACEVPVPKRHWAARLVLPVVILMATAAILAYAARDTLTPATTVAVIPVVTKAHAAGPARGGVVVQAPGWVEADPFPFAVSALADGVVREVLVLEGERVAEGQVVARLVDDDARIALQQVSALLEERQAGLAIARAQLVEAEQNWDHPIELIRKRDTARANLAERQAELEQWPALVAEAQAHAVFLNAEYERVLPLAEAGRAAVIELIRARQDLEAQQAVVEAALKREPILKAKSVALAAEATAAAAALDLRIRDRRVLAEAKAAVQRAAAAVASAAATRAAAALRLDRMEVRSPAAGVVMNRMTEPGAKLMLNMDAPSSAQVVRLYDPARLQVRVDVPLVDAAKVGVGQPAEVIVEILPDRVYQGRISRVVHEADVQKNTLQVKVAIDHPTSELKPEMLARARFLVAPSDTADGAPAAHDVFVPQSAIVRRDGQACLWIADQVARVARLQPVRLGTLVLADWVVVLNGARPGDRIIRHAPEGLRDGQRIRMVSEPPSPVDASR